MIIRRLLPALLVALSGSTDLTARARNPKRLSRSVQSSLFRSASIRGANSGASTLSSPRRRTRHAALASALRGGGSANEVTAYRLQQQLYLQTRSQQLRQALIDRGLTELDHSRSSKPVAVRTDWDCAVATETAPKGCLFSFNAETGAKVIAPIDTTDWITLAALNRLRRNDPTKVEPLWYSKYTILQSWFRSSSPFSLYAHLSPTALFLSHLLDSSFALGAVLVSTMLLVVLITWPVWEASLHLFLTSDVLWLKWHQWGRFVHAALPLKLLLGQMALKWLSQGFGLVYGRIRERLVEWECQFLEDCTPVTIVEEETDDSS